MNLIHNKFQTANGTCLYTQENQKRIHENINELLKRIEDETGEKYYLISAPTEITKIDGNAKIIQIDADAYSYNEIKDVIEKAAIYDGLCD